FRSPLGGGAHQVDPAAWRVHLLAEHPVCRALRQTDAAVHAGPQPIDGRRVLEVECPRHRPPTKRPGFRVELGSNSFLILDMIVNNSGWMGPHTSRPGLSSAGTLSTIALPPSGTSPSRNGARRSFARTSRDTEPSSADWNTPLPAWATMEASSPRRDA